MTLKAREPFVFYSRLHLIELTGVRATTLPELLDGLRTASGSCIYHHTLNFLQQHQYLVPEPANDFSLWVSEALGDDALGEKLAGIDVMSYPSIGAIREALIETIESALQARTRLKKLSAPEGEEFDFYKSVSFVFPTQYRSTTLEEFSDCLRSVSLSSIYFHMFEARFRLDRPTNDFSNWLIDSLDEKDIAVRIAQLDPCTLSGEGLRSSILKIVGRRISSVTGT